MAPYKSRVKTYEEFHDGLGWTGDANSSHDGGPQGRHPQGARGTQEVLETSGHPFQLLGKGTGDIGGDFTVVRRFYEHASKHVHNRTTTDEENIFAGNYLGSYYAHSSFTDDSDFPTAILVSSSEMAEKGTEAIARVIPTNPINDVVVSLGELRSEGIPSIVGANTWKSRTQTARNAGDEYLNYQFGWKPLVSDVRSLADTVLRFDEIKEKYERESGKLLHRRYSFPVEESDPVITESVQYPVPAISVGFFNGMGKTTKTSTVKRKFWFSGAFTYYLPPKGTMAHDVAIAKKLWGFRLDPEVLWNLTPWTWAVDWFTNAGDVIHNASMFSQDGLVMPYGYIMCESTYDDLYVHSDSTMKRDGTPIDVWQRFTTVVRQREKATPYGFGLTFDSFTDRQLGIMAALGLTRGSTGMKYD